MIEYAEGLGEGVAAVGQTGEEEVHEGEGDKPHRFNYQPPGQRFSHVVSIRDC